MPLTSQLKLRLPADLRAALVRSARTSGHTLSDEVRARLHASLGAVTPLPLLIHLDVVVPHGARIVPRSPQRRR